MRRSSRPKTRRNGSGFEQINGECGGEVNPAVENVSEQSNACAPLKTLEADKHMVKPEELSSNANVNGHKVTKNGKGISNGVSGEEQKSTPETEKKRSNTKSSGSHRELVISLPCRGQVEIHRSKISTTNSKSVERSGERNELSSSHKRPQRSKEAAASSSVNANSTPVDRPKKRKKVMKKGQVREDDEYAKIKNKLRYLLKRISYEQNLIDAYSLEGWKGSSLEKLRPKKELERATNEILRRKVKIRELFQHLDTLCAEGSLPKSLFDSDGEISCEDIYCSKCGSKDVAVDNDIILCDGFCDRGFHQYCVEPPLRKEDIPPDDENWLCPGCDCKDDSMDLLNDSLGTKLSVSDSWEKIFPEAAAAMAGGDQNLNCDLPSDDSDDEEYNPDGLNDNENDEDGGSDDNDKSENEDGSSDDSDFSSASASASDEMIGSFKEVKDVMDLPSDDSEDDDFDPDAATLEEDKIQESSNSDSEDHETSFEGDKSNRQDDANSESDAGIDDGLVDVPGRRKVERLDYKKLYDEEYENVSTSSSDDEDWDKTAGKEDSESADEEETLPLKQPSEAEDHTSTKKPKQKSKRENKKDTSKAPQEAPGVNGCSGVKSLSSANKQIELRNQRLFKSFEENKYPDNTTKESLAKELQMTEKQVHNWFRNRRSSTSKKTVSKEDAVQLRTGKEGEGQTSVAGTSEQTMETKSVAKSKIRAAESNNTGSRKRRRR